MYRHIPPGPDTSATSVLTSASLVRSSDDENVIIDNLTIKVRLPDDLIVTGWLHHYDLKYDIAVVNIDRISGICTPKMSSRVQQFESTNLVAWGRCFDSCMLTSTPEIDIDRLSNELDMALIGGLLIDFNWIFAGIICRRGERAVFVPQDKIIESFGEFWI